MDPLLIKLSPPTIDTAYTISRTRLLNLLINDERWKVSTITAPAGYGKTVLIHQTVEALRQSFVWYQLDIYDNDLAVIINYLITGVRHIVPDFGKQTSQLLALSGPIQNPHLIASAMCNDLTKQTDCGILLVLDDFHVITEPSVHLFFQELIQYLPANVRLIISSRNSIPLSLSRLHAAGALIPITTEDLCFTKEELAALLIQRQISVTDETIENFIQRSSGWPVALGFFQINDDAHPFTIDNKAISAYLTNEVLDKQPKKIRHFLLATSVLEYLTPEIADLFLNRNDSAEILTYLTNKQLFITALEGESQAYRYHQLFRDFLLNCLGPKKNDLYKKAAELALKQGKIKSAIDYYQAANLKIDQIELVKKAGLQEIINGHWQTVLRWLSSIPIEDIKSEPWLSFYQATVFLYQGRVMDTEPLVRSAISGFKSAQDKLGLIESRILKARILNFHGRYQDALEELEKVFAMLPAEERGKRFYLPLEKSLCLAKLGRLLPAEAVLNEALELAKEENNPQTMVFLIEGLASISYLLGEYSKSLQLLRLADKTVPERVMTGYYIQDSVVGIYNDWGENSLAMEHAKRSVATKERFGLRETLPSAYLFLAATYLSQGELSLAEKYFGQAVNLIENDGGDRYLYILARDFLAWVLCISGHWVEAQALMESNLKAASQTGGLILPCTLMYHGMTLASSGRSKEAIPVLNEAAAGLEQASCQVPLCYTYKALAWSLFDQQDQNTARSISEKYLKLASKINLLDGFLLYTHEFLSPIFRYGLEKGIEVTYIQRVLVKAGDRFLKLLEELATHSNPQVRQYVITPLAEIGGRTAQSILEKMASDRDNTVRQLANIITNKFGLAEQKTDLTPQIVIKTLGSIQIINQDLEINGTDWPTIKTRDLLAFLIHKQEPVTIDCIIESLWPEAEPEKASANFHITLHRLRQTLQKVTEKKLILYGGKHYQLLSGTYVTDHRDFENLATRTLAELSDNSSPTKDITDLLEKIVSLYRGDYLSELDYIWVISYQEHLKELFYQVSFELAKLFLKNNEYTRAILYLTKISVGNSLKEEVYCQLMRAYAGIGDWVAVKQQYQVLKTNLQTELGLLPAPQTTELYFSLYAHAGSGESRK